MSDRFNEPPYDPRLDPHHPRYDPRFEPRDDPRFGRDYDPRLDPRYDYGEPPRGGRGAPPPPPPQDSAASTSRGSRGRTLAIIAGLIGLLLVAIFAYRLTEAGPGEDRLDDNANSAASGETATAEERCGSQRTYDLVKQQLFRQAAQTRGTDQAAFDRLSPYAAIRVTSPVLKREDGELGTIVCGGNVALDLPPGVAVVGGRRTLQSNLDYALQPAADGSGDVVTLSGAEGIVVPLATLARTGSQQPGLPQPPAAGQTDSLGQPLGNAPPPNRPAPPPSEPPSPPPTRPAPSVEPGPTAPAPVAEGSARPSFNCDRARTRGEIAVCRDAGLAALDREMAGFFNSAVREADPQTRAILQRTRGRFLAFRDRCTSDRCIADAYRGRITEIRDIVDGRWRGQ